MKTGIIIPCYNEAKRLNTKAFIQFISTKDNYHLCFVNDGSKDDTIIYLQEIQRSNPTRVSIIDMKRNGGKASAVRAGARYLHSRGDIAYVGFMDADLSTDFKDFDSLKNKLDSDRKLKFVFGSRAKNCNENIEKNEFRCLISKAINLLIVFILGLSIDDTQCGAKIFRSELVPVMFDKMFLSRWLFDVEMFLRIKKKFGKASTLQIIHEQPLTKWVHMDDSKLGIKDALEIPFRLLSIWFNYNILNLETVTSFNEPKLQIVTKPELFA